ncbi:hypothetical protein PGTUg99_000059 [Puccinia graminis f. sp. tritici]|nr:hypothetical protein PGTUg99_000059 [Puccinia graminis f. sp. tritici]
MHHSITSTEDEALQVQARELEAMFFRTIDFMHDKNMITHDALMKFLQKEPTSHRLTNHVMMDPKGQYNDLYVKLRKKGGLSYTLAPEHTSWLTSPDPFNKGPHPYYLVGSDGITMEFHFKDALASRKAVDIDTQFEGTRNDLQKLLSQILQSSKEETSDPASYYGQMTRKFRENAEELNSIHEKILQSASLPHGKNADQLNNLQTILKETPLLTEIPKEMKGTEKIKLKEHAKTLQALIFQTIDFMYQKKLIKLDEFEGFFREGNTMQRLANHLMLTSGGNFHTNLQIPFKLGSSEKIQGLITGFLNGNSKEFMRLAFPKPK